MSEADRARWEAKHEQSTGPSSAPLASMGWLDAAGPRGVALDLACGRGRHCGALLELGYRVVAVDIAASALRTLARFGPRDALGRVMPVQADLDLWPFAPGVFDLVLQTDFLDRSLFDSIRKSVRGGGCVLVDTFCGEAGGPGPSCRDYRLRAGELARVFAGWEVIRSGSATPGRDAILARKARTLTRAPRSDTRTP